MNTLVLVLENAKFELGRLVLTPLAYQSLAPNDLSFALQRHISGDWGDVPPEQKKANDSAIENEDQICSTFTSERGIRFCIVTKADREATTVFLFQERL